MKKLITIILSTLILVSCGQQKKETEDNIWLFHLGESKTEVKAALDEKHMPYIDDTVDGLNGIAGHGFELEYAGLDWNGFGVVFEKDTAVAILLMRENQMNKLNNNNTVDYRIDAVVRNMDSMFGEHLTYLPNTDDISNLTKHTWETDKVYAELSSMFEGDVVSLMVCEIKYKDKFKSKNPLDKK